MLYQITKIITVSEEEKVLDRSQISYEVDSSEIAQEFSSWMVSMINNSHWETQQYLNGDTEFNGIATRTDAHGRKVEERFISLKV